MGRRASYAQGLHGAWEGRHQSPGARSRTAATTARRSHRFVGVPFVGVPFIGYVRAYGKACLELGEAVADAPDGFGVGPYLAADVLDVDVGGEEIRDTGDLLAALRDYAPGDSVELTVVSDGAGRAR